MDRRTESMQAKKKKYYKVLQDHTTLIVDNIEVEDFSPRLIQDDVFRETDALEEIKVEKTRRKRASTFLSSLERVDLDRLRKAVDAMKNSYPHVHDPIKAAFEMLDAEGDGNCGSYEGQSRSDAPVEFTKTYNPATDDHYRLDQPDKGRASTDQGEKSTCSPSHDCPAKSQTSRGAARQEGAAYDVRDMTMEEIELKLRLLQLEKERRCKSGQPRRSAGAGTDEYVSAPVSCTDEVDGADDFFSPTKQPLENDEPISHHSNQLL